MTVSNKKNKTVVNWKKKEQIHDDKRQTVISKGFF